MHISFNGACGRRIRQFALSSAIAGLAMGSALAAGVDQHAAALAEAPVVYRGAESTHPVSPTQFKGDLRNLPAAPLWRAGDPIKEIPKRGGAAKPSKVSPKDQAAARARVPLDDPLLEIQQRGVDEYEGKTSRAFSTQVLNFAGQGFTGVNPPDTVGDIGVNYYIQSINGSGGARVAIYNKTTGALAAPIFAMDSLGFGNCASGLGDPVVLYDALAGRWMLSEFSNSGNQLCVYISQTDDPITGGWFAYAFTAPSFPDYPKYGVWPDAYYVSSNETSTAAYAFDRDAMLAGAPATLQRFTAPDLAGFGFQALQPADLDGAVVSPTGAPGIFMRHRDDEVHNGSPVPGIDFLEIWEYSVDFATPANSTFTGPTKIAIAEIDSSLCGLTSFFCFPMPGTSTQLDPLREVVMFRLAYRNFGTYQALVGNLVTDVNGADHGGIRWFELRKNSSAAPWSLYQEGTYAPDSENRFMGSIAMDGAGNIALGYSTTSSSLFPSMRYTGRLAGDALGVMAQGEHTIVAGTGSNNSNRWGDYSAMNVDPVDDCTFWHTNEYSLSNGQWATQIASFRFDACGTPGFTLSPDVSDLEVCAPGPVSPAVNLGLNSVSDYTGVVTLALQSPVAGITGSFSTNPVNVPGASSLSLNVNASVSSGDYEVVVEGTAVDADSRQATLSLSVEKNAPGATTLVSPTNNSTVSTTSPTLSWNAVTRATGYIVQVALDPGFSNIIINDTTSGTSYTANGLSTETTYYWRVRTTNICGAGGVSATFSFTTGAVICATGPVAIPDNGGDGNPAVLNISSGNPGTIDDLDVSILADHTYVGDLRFVLTHLDTGTSVVLIDRPGVPASTFGCSSDDVDVVMDDASTTVVETTCGTNPALGGVLKPHQPLAAFNGEDLAGTWRMAVSDNAGIDLGTLDEWCLLPTVSGVDPDSDADGVPDSSDNCTDVANPLQQDSNGDNIGNACDTDIAPVIEDCQVNFLDLNAIKDAFFATPVSPNWNPDADFDSDNFVNFNDLLIMADQFFGPPGPSAAGCN